MMKALYSLPRAGDPNISLPISLYASRAARACFSAGASTCIATNSSGVSATYCSSKFGRCNGFGVCTLLTALSVTQYTCMRSRIVLMYVPAALRRQRPPASCHEEGLELRA